MKDPANYFYLVVKGDSMVPRIQDGDLAVSKHRQPTLENGDLGVMVFGEGEGTLKKYIQRGNAVILQPFNPAYEEKGDPRRGAEPAVHRGQGGGDQGQVVILPFSPPGSPAALIL